MLIACPDCSRQVSDRAYFCPGCGFPVREERAALLEAERRRISAETREEVGAVDCVPCQGKGLINLSEEVHGYEGFEWCPICGHSGRVILCQAAEGYYAVSHIQLEAFLKADLHDGDPGVSYLGEERPSGFRYEEKKKRYKVEKIPAWFIELMPKLPPNTPTGDASPSSPAKAVERSGGGVGGGVEMHGPMAFLANIQGSLKKP